MKKTINQYGIQPYYDIRVLDCFSGIGNFTWALKIFSMRYPFLRFTSVGFIEIKNSAIKAYKALHGNDVKCLGDITKLSPEDIEDFDMLCMSPPCQSVSRTGSRKGMQKDTETPSSLIWKCEPIIREKRPKIILMETVSGVTDPKFKRDLTLWKLTLQKYGYHSYYQILRASDYGVPQNRPRFFMVSIREDMADTYFIKAMRNRRALPYFNSENELKAA